MGFIHRDEDLINPDIVNLNSYMRFTSPHWSRAFVVKMFGSEAGKQHDWFMNYFQWTPDGFLVVKNFGNYHTPPKRWRYGSKAKLSALVNTHKRDACSYGINFGTLSWFNSGNTFFKIHSRQAFPTAHVAVPYICLIRWEWFGQTVVPIERSYWGHKKEEWRFVRNKARCGILQIVEPVFNVEKELEKFNINVIRTGHSFQKYVLTPTGSTRKSQMASIASAKAKLLKIMRGFMPNNEEYMVYNMPVPGSKK